MFFAAQSPIFADTSFSNHRSPSLPGAGVLGTHNSPIVWPCWRCRARFLLRGTAAGALSQGAGCGCRLGGLCHSDAIVGTVGPLRTALFYSLGLPDLADLADGSPIFSCWPTRRPSERPVLGAERHRPLPGAAVSSSQSTSPSVWTPGDGTDGPERVAGSWGRYRRAREGRGLPGTVQTGQRGSRTPGDGTDGPERVTRRFSRLVVWRLAGRCGQDGGWTRLPVNW